MKLPAAISILVLVSMVSLARGQAALEYGSAEAFEAIHRRDPATEKANAKLRADLSTIVEKQKKPGEKDDHALRRILHDKKSPGRVELMAIIESHRQKKQSDDQVLARLLTRADMVPKSKSKK